MAKKNLKRGLALGALMAFVITGSAMAESIRNANLTDVTVVNASSDFEKPWGEVSDRSYAYAADDGGSYTISSGNDGLITISNTLTGFKRNYGLALENNSTVTVNNNLKIVASNANNAVRAIRNNGGSNLNIEKDLTIEVTTERSSYNDIVGIDVWSGVVNGNVTDTVTTIKGDVDVTVKGNNSSGSWVNSILLGDATLNLNGTTTKLHTENYGYSAQSVNLKAGWNNSKAVLNFNSDSTEIFTKSNYGVNGLATNNSENVINFNKGSVTINSVVQNGIGSSNAIGYLGGGTLNVSENVDAFNIIIEGAGVDNGDSNNSNGTAGIYERGGETIINSKSLNISVTSGEDTANSTFDTIAADSLGSDYCTAYGLRVDVTGSIYVGDNTVTTINVNDNYKNAIGIYAGSHPQYLYPGYVEILGDTTITAEGGLGTYAVLANTGSEIRIGSSGKKVDIAGNVLSDGTFYYSANGETYNSLIEFTGATEINSKISNDGDRVVNAINGGQITFAGESTIIKGEGTVNGKAFAVVAEGTSDKQSVINFNAKTTEITLDDKGGGSWSYGVDAKANSKIEFNGEDVTINDHKETYTAQNVTVRANAEIDFNNTGTTNINTTSKASVTGIDVKEGGVLNFNKGKVNVVSSIQSSSGEGSINAIGIQVHDDDVSELNVNEGVDSFVVQVNGQGYDYNGTSYSSGTAALKVSDKSIANINSKTADFQVLFNGSASGDATHNMAYALWTTETAQINIGSDTVTDISVTKSGPQAGIAIGVYANGGTIDVKGDTTVNASGIAESNALKADSNGVINIGSAGKAVSLTGDVVADGGAINVTGAGVELTGNIETLNSGEATFSGEAVNFTGKALTNGGTTKLSIGKGTWNITDASTLTDVIFGAGSTLMIDDGSKYTGGNYAVTASGKAEVEDGAKLIVNGVKEETYNIVKAGTINGKWAESDITIDNALMSYEWSAEDASKLDLVVKPKSADEITNSTGVNSSTGSMLSDVVNMASSDDYNKGDNAGVDFIVNAMAGQASGNTPRAAGAAINSALQIAEAGGNSATSVSVVNNVTGITTQRLSFSQMNTAPQGGHGKVERKYKTGAGIWAQYMHGKDKVEDMPMDGMKSSYDSQYNGAVIGYDFAEIGKVKYGIAFNYGEGDSHSKNSSISTRSDFDFWGIGLYSSIMNDDTNVIFDINYSKSDSDVTQINGATTLEANPETTSLSAGVKFEKLIQKDTVQVVPYAGLRFMTVDTDDYAANIAGKKAFMYAPERQNIWLIPVGVSLRQENSYENGWKVTPKADLSYIWAIGDTDSSMTVSIPGITNVSSMNYTVMDNGSFLGTLGIEAEKGDWTYGLSYSYQKGEYQRSDKWFVDVRYSF